MKLRDAAPENIAIVTQHAMLRVLFVDVQQKSPTREEIEIFISGMTDAEIIQETNYLSAGEFVVPTGKTRSNVMTRATFTYAPASGSAHRQTTTDMIEVTRLSTGQTGWLPAILLRLL